MDLILYHGKCTDGWTAAYVASKKYRDATLVPMFFSTEPPFELVENKDVLVVDFSWKTKDVNRKLVGLAKSFYILDHHKSAAEVLAGEPYAFFDNKRSGAGLAWDFLFGYEAFNITLFETPFENLVNKGDVLPRPWYVNYVEDYDLWNKKLPLTDTINAYLHSLEHTKEVWDDVMGWEHSQAYAENIGEGMVRQQKYQVRALLDIANSGKGWGLTIGVVNAPYFMSSDLGHALAKTHDVGMTWYERKDGKTVFSLRSIGDIDVSKIAMKFGGGGHLNAAGFEMDFYEAKALLTAIVVEGNK